MITSSAGITRSTKVEAAGRVLAWLKHRLMAPEAAEVAMRAYAEEMNRLNRELSSNGEAWRMELAKVEKQIGHIVEAIADGMYHPVDEEADAGSRGPQGRTDLLAHRCSGRRAGSAAECIGDLRQKGRSTS